MSEADRLNAALREGLPAAGACLSDLGRRAYFPAGIPFQSAQARGTRYNGTIGQVTDGRGRPLPLPALADPLTPLQEEMAHLYSPPQGHSALREAWKARQQRFSGGSTVKTTLPFVAIGLTQALGFIAELFTGVGQTVILPAPRWGNYDQVFGLRRQADIVNYDLFVDGEFSLEPLRAVLARTAGPAVLVLNFPHNPSGFSPSTSEVQEIVRLVTAHAGPLVVLCDDAYGGLIHEETLPRRSMFWDLAEAADPARHAIFRADGVTKELLFFPGRVGFLTAALDPDSPAAEALESKLKCLARSSVGSPPGPSQALVLRALQQDALEDQVRAAHRVLIDRYRVLKQALAQVTSDNLRPFPFNSGVFAMVGVSGEGSEALRRRLIADHDVGVIAVSRPNAIRIAYCSVSEEDLPALVERLGEAVK
jgi:aspartate/methionine/tyrosine aminotransferase